MGKKHYTFGPFKVKNPFNETQRSKLRRARDDEDLFRRLREENIIIDKKKLNEDFIRLKKALKYHNNKR